MRSSMALLLVALATAPAAAQFPGRTVYVGATNPFPLGTGLLGLDRVGSPIRFVPLSTSNGFVTRLEMDWANRGIMVWDATGFRSYDLASGRISTVALPAHTLPAGNGFLDEHGGLAWLGYANPSFPFYPLIFRAAGLTGANPLTVTTVHRGSPASGNIGPCWNGSTGGYVSCSKTLIEFFDRQGNRTRTVPFALNYVTDMDWSPWSGDVVLVAGTQITRVTQSGVPSTLATIGGLRVETLEQTLSGQEAFLVLANGPTRLLDIDGHGAVTTIVTAPGSFAYLQCVIPLRARSLWGTGAWVRGTVARLNLDFGPARAGDAYRVALSFSHMPGIPLGGPYLHLAPDTLFALTAAGDVPGFTAGFSGTLDVWGRAMPSPSITIPRVPALQGVRVFCGAIAHSVTRITAATNCYGATIQ